MRFVQFKPFAQRSEFVMVDPKQVTHLTYFEYQHWYGTKIHMDSGTEVECGESPQEVAKKLEAAKL